MHLVELTKENRAEFIHRDNRTNSHRMIVQIPSPLQGAATRTQIPIPLQDHTPPHQLSMIPSL